MSRSHATCRHRDMLSDRCASCILSRRDDNMHPLWEPELPITTSTVDHPSHYNAGSIECIEAIKASMSREAYLGFLKGNLIKYCWRYESKGRPAEDIGKAVWYATRLQEELKEDQYAT